MAVINRLLQQRHAFYRGLLVVEVLALVGLRGLEEAPRLVSLVYLVIASVAVLLDSPLLPQHRLKRKVGESIPQQLKLRLQKALLRRQVVGFAWLLAFLIEVIWQTALVIDPALAVQLSVLHLVVWLVLMLQLLWGLVNALAEEPLFNSDLLMGAAAGYLLVGFTGGIVLNSLLVLDPAAFNLQDHGHALPVGVGHAPAMLGAAFASLTTLGSPSLTNGSLTSLREWISPGSKPGRWKPVKISPVRDLFAASLFIRSQSLAKGEKVRTLVFPGGSPFLVDIESLGPEKITIAGSPRDALRLDIKIQSVNTKKGNALEPHRKFRSGTLWLSNDADRKSLGLSVNVSEDWAVCADGDNLALSKSAHVIH